MKSLFACSLIFGILTAPAFAANNSQSVTVPAAITVGTTQLPAGHYKVTWTGTGSSVQVTLKQQDTSHPAAATFTAKAIDEKHDRVQVTISSQGGVNTLEAIQLSRISLVLGSSPAPGQ